jgi:hypothetical protein
MLAMPPGERVTTTRGSVKTGATDSAWIRTVGRATENDSATYVILSADGDVAAAFKRWDLTAPLILKSYKSLAEALEGAEFPALTGEYIRRIVDRVVGEDWQAGLVAFDPVDEGGLVSFRARRRRDILA